MQIHAGVEIVVRGFGCKFPPIEPIVKPADFGPVLESFFLLEPSVYCFEFFKETIEKFHLAPPIIKRLVRVVRGV